MGSSFLTVINLGLSFYCILNFLKLIIQFGAPNHPSRFLLYLITLSVTLYFVMRSIVSFSLIDPFLYNEWRTFPLITGSFVLVWQVIFLGRKFSLIQKKIISRMPLIGAILIYSFFSDLADQLFIVCLLVAVLNLTFFVGCARFEKRILLKMFFFFGLMGMLHFFNEFWLHVSGELMLFPILFYFFTFEQSLGVGALIEEELVGEKE